MSSKQPQEHDDVTQENGAPRGAPTAWILGTIGVTGAALVALVGLRAEDVEPRDTREAMAAANEIGSASPISEVSSSKADVVTATEAEAAVVATVEPTAAEAAEAAAAEAARAAAAAAEHWDTYGYAETRSYNRPDPSEIASRRRLAEIMELSCSEYGTNCKEAQLMRRQLDEIQNGR